MFARILVRYRLYTGASQSSFTIRQLCPEYPPSVLLESTHPVISASEILPPVKGLEHSSHGERAKLEW